MRTCLTELSAPHIVATGGRNITGAGQAGDLNGYVWAKLKEPVTLAAGKEYFLVSSEGGADTYFDHKVWMQPHPGLLSGLVRPVSTKTTIVCYSSVHRFELFCVAGVKGW
jgi:hypothetical protein